MAELLTSALSLLDERALDQLLAPSCGIWLSSHTKISPINGWVWLLTRDEGQIDAGTRVGNICLIARDRVANDVSALSRQLGLFGIWAGWFDQMTYVASVN